MAYRLPAKAGGRRKMLHRPSKRFLHRHGGAFKCPSCGVERLGVAGLLVIVDRLPSAAITAPICRACWQREKGRKRIPIIYQAGLIW